MTLTLRRRKDGARHGRFAHAIDEERGGPDVPQEWQGFFSEVMAGTLLHGHRNFPGEPRRERAIYFPDHVLSLP